MMTVRCADAWDLTDGSPAPEAPFFPPGAAGGAGAAEAVRTQIAARLATGSQSTSTAGRRRPRPSSTPGGSI